MHKVLYGLIGKKCLVYLYDVIIFVSLFEETLANLRLVMAHLQEHNLLAKARKCELFETNITFLGHVVSEEGIATDPAKVEKICNLSAPKDKGYKKNIGTWKLLQAVHQELLRNNSPFAGTIEEVCPLRVGRRTRAGFH